MRTAQTTVHAIRSTRRCGSSLGVHARQHTAHLLDQLLLDNCLVMSKFEWFSPSTARTSWMIEMSEENQASTSELQDDVLQVEGFPTCQRVAKGTCEAARGESAREQSVRTVRGQRSPPNGDTPHRRSDGSTETTRTAASEGSSRAVRRPACRSPGGPKKSYFLRLTGSVRPSYHLPGKIVCSVVYFVGVQLRTNATCYSDDLDCYMLGAAPQDCNTKVPNCNMARTRT